MPKPVIYTTPTCRYCRMLKEFLAEHGVPFDEYDVIADETARQTMMVKSHQQGTPVIDLGDDVYVGFNPIELGRVLGIRKSK